VPVWLRNRLVASLLCHLEAGLHQQLARIQSTDSCHGKGARPDNCPAEAATVADGESIAIVTTISGNWPHTFRWERLLIGGRSRRPRVLNDASRRGLGSRPVGWKSKMLPAAKQPLLARLARPEAVVTVGFRYAGQPAAGEFHRAPIPPA